MSKFVKRRDRGKVLYLIELDQRFTKDPVYIDASRVLKSAERDDKSAGYPEGGPSLATEIAKARDYASYVSTHANADTLREFNTKDYRLFTSPSEDRPKKGHPRSTSTQGRAASTGGRDVRSRVSA